MASVQAEAAIKAFTKIQFCDSTDLETISKKVDHKFTKSRHGEKKSPWRITRFRKGNTDEK